MILANISTRYYLLKKIYNDCPLLFIIVVNDFLHLPLPKAFGTKGCEENQFDPFRDIGQTN